MLINKTAELIQGLAMDFLITVRQKNYINLLYDTMTQIVRRSREKFYLKSARKKGGECNLKLKLDCKNKFDITRNSCVVSF